MQETCTVTVRIEDGEWSIQKRISLDLLCSSSSLSQLFSPYISVLKDIPRYVTWHGFGTGQSASESSLPTGY